VGVGVPATVGVFVGVCVGVLVGVNVFVGVFVGVCVGVLVGQTPPGHGVGVSVGDGVRVAVGVFVGVRVCVGVGDGVAVKVAVGDGSVPPVPHVTVASTSAVGMFTASSSKSVVPAIGSSASVTRCSGTVPSALHWNVMTSINPVDVDDWNAHPPFSSGGSSFKNQNIAGQIPPVSALTTVSFDGSYRSFMFQPAHVGWADPGVNASSLVLTSKFVFNGCAVPGATTFTVAAASSCASAAPPPPAQRTVTSAETAMASVITPSSAIRLRTRIIKAPLPPAYRDLSIELRCRARNAADAPTATRPTPPAIAQVHAAPSDSTEPAPARGSGPRVSGPTPPAGGRVGAAATGLT
jgi:hypothetical protein